MDFLSFKTITRVDMILKDLDNFTPYVSFRFISEMNSQDRFNNIYAIDTDNNMNFIECQPTWKNIKLKYNYDIPQMNKTLCFNSTKSQHDILDKSWFTRLFLRGLRHDNETNSLSSIINSIGYEVSRSTESWYNFRASITLNQAHITNKVNLFDISSNFVTLASTL